MIERLSISETAQIKGLATGLSDQGMAQSVLRGIRPGIVGVDRKKNPSSLLIAAPEGGFSWLYLAGDSRDAGFRRDVASWLFDERALGDEVNFAFLACDSPDWEEPLAEILAPRAVIPDRRLHYECGERPAPWRDSVPAGYRIEDLDQRFLDGGLGVHPKVVEWMNANFGSPEGFLAHGVGAVAVDDRKIVGWILADSLIDGLCDIGGETEEAHRQKGLAYASTCRAIELAFDRGAERVGWHCHAINLPSVHTARKAGFQLRREYPVYPIHFHTESHAKLTSIIATEFIEAAEEALSNGDIAHACELLETTVGFAGRSVIPESVEDRIRRSRLDS